MGRVGEAVTEKPWVWDDREVGDRSQRIDKEKRHRKTWHGCDAGLGGQAGCFQPLFGDRPWANHCSPQGAPAGQGSSQTVLEGRQCGHSGVSGP